ncbi:MAG: hypothetical protein QME12_06980 [Nanoarchaeota archaeon]|nr:hypothetical protein [Nanoarchaeota archaeon]
MKKQSWNLQSGNRKGFILSLDAVVAILIAFIFIAVSTYYIAKANEDQFSRMQMMRQGSDIMAVLDRESVFETKEPVSIGDEISSILPSAYEMRLKIDGTFPEETIIVETTNQTPENQFIVGGERLLVISNLSGSTYATARYWMWLR